MKRLLLIACLFALPAVPAVAEEDFMAGLAAYDAGDYRRARKIWRSLAEEGDVDAQTSLAGMYLMGSGVARNFRLAAKWYRPAAEQGDAIAQLNLGDLYGRGLGVEKDLVRAWLWLSLAAAAEHDWAADRREVIAKSMTKAELDAARDMLFRWRETHPEKPKR
jgi:TPR repeat protein